jgi:hypothetical protein
VRHIQEKRLPHPFAPLLQSLGMIRRAEPPGFAGERQQVFRTAVRWSVPDAAAG